MHHLRSFWRPFLLGPVLAIGSSAAAQNAVQLYRMNQMSHIYRTLLATVALAVSSVTASAETITVCARGCDYTSINAAIGAASDGDVIQLAAETYFEGEQIDTLGKKITLRGVLDKAGEPASVLDGGGTHRVLICQNGQIGETVFENLVIQNGSAGDGGGMYNVGASPTLINCSFTSNSADNSGGGLHSKDTGTTTLINCTFAFNVANVYGGSVFCRDGDIAMSSCTITDSSSGDAGGGIFLVGCMASLDQCHVSRNTSADSGGGGILAFDATLTIDSCDIDENLSLGPQEGGAIRSWNSVIYLNACSITGNNSNGGGGGSGNVNGSALEMSKSAICGNTSGQIFGGYTDLGGNCISDVCDDTDNDGTPDCLDNCPDDPNKTEPGDCGCGVADTDTDGDGIADCIDPCPTWPYDCSEDGQTITVAAGQSIQDAIDAVPDGGTVLVSAGTYAVNLEFGGRSINLASVEGPAVSILDGGLNGSIIRSSPDSGATISLTGFTLINGTGTFVGTPGGEPANSGGAIYVVGERWTVTNCVFRENSASYGGAIYVEDSNSGNDFSGLIVVDCVFEENEASRQGGAITSTYTEVSIFGTSFSSNSCVESPFASIGGACAFGSTAVLIENSSFEGNFAFRNGGALEVHGVFNGESASALIVGSVFTGNVANESGGSLRIDDGMSVEIGSASFCENTPSQIEGSYSDLGGNCILEECGDDLDGNGIPDACDPCLGDITGNGVVDAADLGILLALWNTDGKSAPEADINGDGTVNAADLGLLLGAWGPCP